jgi:hypothetical protein
MFYYGGNSVCSSGANYLNLFRLLIRLFVLACSITIRLPLIDALMFTSQGLNLAHYRGPPQLLQPSRVLRQLLPLEVVGSL